MARWGARSNRLPHWARVAFAARCARVTFPVFDRCWPDAGKEFRAAVLSAITIAEDAAASAISPLVVDVARAANQAAGRAQIPHICPYELDPEDGPSPPDSATSSLAALTAKVAENAARTAGAKPTDSALAASEAFRFAVGVAVEGGQRELLEQLSAEFGALLRVARKGRWRDTTPVPPSVFMLLDAEVPSPWRWRFW